MRAKIARLNCLRTGSTACWYVLEQFERVLGPLFQIGAVGLDSLPIAVTTGLFGLEPALLTHEQGPAG